MKTDDLLQRCYDKWPYDWPEGGFEGWKNQLALLVVSGSKAYGLDTPESDTDLMGVMMPTEDQLFGLDRWDTWNPDGVDEGLDITIYSLEKFVRLLMKGNPNIVEMLWVPGDCVLVLSPEGNELIQNRDLFATQNIVSAVKGYIQNHRRRMDRGVTRKMGAKRKKAIEEHGYDPKAACHAVRWAKMAIQLLDTGELPVRMGGHNGAVLKSIKKGDWRREAVLTVLSNLEAIIVGTVNSDVPEDVDREEVNSLLKRLQKGPDKVEMTLGQLLDLANTGFKLPEEMVVKVRDVVQKAA